MTIKLATESNFCYLKTCDAIGRIRIDNLPVSSQVLCPVELRGRYTVQARGAGSEVADPQPAYLA